MDRNTLALERRILTMATNTVNTNSAEFTINGKPGNQKIGLGEAIVLQAVDAQAMNYCWEVFSDPPGCTYQLIGEFQAQATLTPHDAATYIVKLSATRNDDRAVARSLLWITTGQQKYRLPATGEPLRFNGEEGWAGDLIQAVKAVDGYLPSAVQKAALEAASNPGQNNPFATKNDLPAPELTIDQKAALDAANDAGQTNPFATRYDVPSPDQKAALGAANAPSGSNPFATKSDLSAPELTPDQNAALDAANAPSGTNPFATKSDLPAPELTPEQKAALDMANSPGRSNPFATRNDLPRPELTSNQKAALDSAHNPSAANPLATMADIPVIRTVAASSVDLSRVLPPTTPGRIGVIASDPSRGLATLSFVNYDASRRDAYIVKALPINARAGRQHGDREGHENKKDDDDRREIVVVQLVEFAAGGFTLHMVELPNRKPALGPCLVEVSEIG
jgi:hypothetical protein